MTVFSVKVAINSSTKDTRTTGMID